MLNRIKAWLETGTDIAPKQRGGAGSMQLAAAALLMEAACEDGRLDAEEVDLICALLTEHFALSPAQGRVLTDEGREAQSRAAGVFRFTRASVDTMDEAQRVRLVEMMWDVIYSDGVVHDFEANLMRRICGLLGVADRVSGQARKRAEGLRIGKA